MAATRPDLDRLTAAVDALGTAFGDLAIETFDRDDLRQASIQVTRAGNMIDGVRADLARKARDLQPPGTPTTATSSRTLRRSESWRSISGRAAPSPAMEPPEPPGVTARACRSRPRTSAPG